MLSLNHQPEHSHALIRKHTREPFVPLEKRVTAFLMSERSVPMSISSVFEQFIVEHQKVNGHVSGPRMRNAILVNERNEELSISAGGTLDGVYVFTHSNKANNSVFIVLYLGPTRSLQYGKDLLMAFKEFLNSHEYQIKDYVVTSNEDEAVEESITQEEVASYVNHHQASHPSIAKVLDLVCNVSQ